MAKKKNVFFKRLSSFLLFIVINIVVFNAGTIFNYSKIAIGAASLKWSDVAKIDIDMDNILGNRTQVFSFNENIIINFANELHLYNIDGKLMAKKEINSNTTKIVGMNSSFLVSDFIQGNIAIIDYLGNSVGTINALGNIDEIVGVKNDIFAVITNDGELKVFDIYGSEISTVSLPQGEFLNIDVSQSEELLLVTLLSSDEYSYNSKMITYSMKKNEMIGGTNNTDKIVYKAKIFDEDVIVVDYNGVYVYKLNDATNESSWNYERDGELITFDIDSNGNFIEIISMSEVEDVLGTGEYHLVGINKDGDMLYDLVLDDKYSKVTLGYGKILIYNENSLLIFNSNGDIIANRDVNKSIYKVTWLSETRLLVEYNDFIELLDLSY